MLGHGVQADHRQRQGGNICCTGFICDGACMALPAHSIWKACANTTRPRKSSRVGGALLNQREMRHGGATAADVTTDIPRTWGSGVRAFAP